MKWIPVTAVLLVACSHAQVRRVALDAGECEAAATTTCAAAALTSCEPPRLDAGADAWRIYARCLGHAGGACLAQQSAQCVVGAMIAAGAPVGAAARGASGVDPEQVAACTQESACVGTPACARALRSCLRP